MSKLLSECIISGALKTFDYKVVIRNETSQTLITNPDLISIKELSMSGIILEMPLNSCQIGHNLSLFFFNGESIPDKIRIPRKGPYRKAELEAMTKVEQIELNTSTTTTILVEMNFTQVELRIWEVILNKYAANQNKVDNLFTHQLGRRVKNG